MGTSIVPAVQATTLFVPELGPRRKEAAIQYLVAYAREAGAIRDCDCVRETVLLRERLGSTAIGKGVAIPNARSLGVIEPRLVFARSTRGIEWSAPDGQPVHLVLLALSPAELPYEQHLDSLARAAAATRLARHRARLMEATGSEAVALLLRPGTP